MKYFCILLLFVFSASIQTAYACSNSTNEYVLKQAKKDRKKMKMMVSNLARQSDTIFVGRIVALKGRTATFEDIINLKGKGIDSHTYSWEAGIEEIGCDAGIYDFGPVSITNDSYWTSYIIYAKGSVILRAKEINQHAKAPSPHEEIEWLRK